MASHTSDRKGNPYLAPCRSLCPYVVLPLSLEEMMEVCIDIVVADWVEMQLEAFRGLVTKTRATQQCSTE